MQLLGFNLKKISAERSPNFKRGPINTNIEFNDVDREKIDLLKDLDALKISFAFTVNYSDSENKDIKHGHVSFEGDLALSAEKEEVKEILKSWKKKEIAEQFRVPLINFIIQKCSTRALALEDELNIPSHIPFPKIQKVASNQKDQ